MSCKPTAATAWFLNRQASAQCHPILEPGTTVQTASESCELCTEIYPDCTPQTRHRPSERHPYWLAAYLRSKARESACISARTSCHDASDSANAAADSVLAVLGGSVVVVAVVEGQFATRMKAPMTAMNDSGFQRPDLSYWRHGHCAFVGDVKYKRLSTKGYEHADLFQLLAYTIATGLAGGLPICAHGEAERQTHTISHAGKTLTIATVNLAGSPADVLKQVSRIAEAIRTAVPVKRMRVA